MLFDLISMDMYGNYNIKLAHLIGLKEAIYVSELLNINRKALQKNKLKEGFFTIDRKYITQRTTLSVEEQVQIEERLKSMMLISKGTDLNLLCVNTDKLTGLILEENEKIVDAITVAGGRKMSKREAIAAALKTNIQTSNQELISAYAEWIDAILTKFGWMSKKAVMEGQARVDEYSQKDLDVALKILEIATLNGYRDINFAINSFERNFKREFEARYVEPHQAESRTILSEEVF